MGLRVGYVLESGEQRVKNLMVFDVGRWNLLKTTLGTVDLVGIMLRTHHEETVESPGHNTDHRELDPGC